MTCDSFTSPNCRNVQLLEPSDTLLTVTSSGSSDQSLDESGSTPIPLGGPARLTVEFVTQKASDNYRFEYLYVETPGISNPGDPLPVVVDRQITGFTVDWAGVPLGTGYVLQWRVLVVGLVSGFQTNIPENLYLQLPVGQRTFTATFQNPRVDTGYGFTELRIENLVDTSDAQRAIIVQVVAKNITNFVVGLNPPPDTTNYFLVCRTP